MLTGTAQIQYIIANNFCNVREKKKKKITLSLMFSLAQLKKKKIPKIQGSYSI